MKHRASNERVALGGIEPVSFCSRFAGCEPRVQRWSSPDLGHPGVASRRRRPTVCGCADPLFGHCPGFEYLQGPAAPTVRPLSSGAIQVRRCTGSGCIAATCYLLRPISCPCRVPPSFQFASHPCHRWRNCAIEPGTPPRYKRARTAQTANLLIGSVLPCRSILGEY